VLVDCSLASPGHLTATGTCIMVEGELKQPPEGTKQRVELKVEKILEVGTVEPKYPIAKTKLSMEYLRGFMHLRPRTNTVCLDSGYICLQDMFKNSTTMDLLEA
jgi:asparaginyl-tRNA synthetase